MTDDFPQSVLFPIIRRGMGLSNNSVYLKAEDFQHLYQYGIKQSILPIISQGVMGIVVPDEWKKKFDFGCAKEQRAYLLRDHSLRQISKALNTHEIPFIFLKGSVIRDLYPECWMRTSCDIDVLVREEDLSHAVEMIEAQTDFKAQNRNYHDVSMLSTSLHLELHFSIRENMENIDSLLSQVWEYASPTGKGSMYQLSPEFQVFHVVAHMSYHMLHGGLGIRPFIDLWLLRNKTVLDEDTVRTYCDSCGILKFYETACKLSDEWMENKPHSETTALLEDYCLKGSVFGSAELADAGKQRKYKGVRYIFSRVFMKNSVLQEMYPVLKTNSYLLPVYQMKRWARLLNKDKRKQIRVEMNRMNNTSLENIDSFDKLLTSIGL